MFPGFVTAFKDKEGFIHLYFYPGLDENNNHYYRDLDLSNCKVKYKTTKNSDSSREYIFENKKILKITCKLIDKEGKLHIKELSI